MTPDCGTLFFIHRWQRRHGCGFLSLVCPVSFGRTLSSIQKLIRGVRGFLKALPTLEQKVSLIFLWEQDFWSPAGLAFKVRGHEVESNVSRVCMSAMPSRLSPHQFDLSVTMGLSARSPMPQTWS